MSRTDDADRPVYRRPETTRAHRRWWPLALAVGVPLLVAALAVAGWLLFAGPSEAEIHAAYAEYTTLKENRETLARLYPADTGARVLDGEDWVTPKLESMQQRLTAAEVKWAKHWAARGLPVR